MVKEAVLNAKQEPTLLEVSANLAAITAPNAMTRVSAQSVVHPMYLAKVDARSVEMEVFTWMGDVISARCHLSLMGKEDVFSALKEHTLMEIDANLVVRTAMNAIVREDVQNVINRRFLMTVNAMLVVRELFLRIEDVRTVGKTVYHA
jgi:hypothetical protein